MLGKRHCCGEIMESWVQIVQSTWGDGYCIREDRKTFDNLREAKKFVRDWFNEREDIEPLQFENGTGYAAEYYNADCSHCIANVCAKRYDEEARCPDDWYERVSFHFLEITPIKVGKL